MTTSEIRGWATALPEVTEKQHFRFKVPLRQVRGMTLLGMGRDETTAVFCITEEPADAAAAADPEHAAAVRRMDARRSFLGLKIELAALPAKRVEALMREAWVSRAPRALVKQHIGEPSRDRAGDSSPRAEHRSLTRWNRRPTPATRPAPTWVEKYARASRV